MAISAGQLLTGLIWGATLLQPYTMTQLWMSLPVFYRRKSEIEQHSDRWLQPDNAKVAENSARLLERPQSSPFS